MDFSITKYIAGLIGIARGIKDRRTKQEGSIVKFEIVQPEDPAKEYQQMAELFRLNVRPETIARFFGIGRKR